MIIKHNRILNTSTDNNQTNCIKKLNRKNNYQEIQLKIIRNIKIMR